MKRILLGLLLLFAFTSLASASLISPVRHGGHGDGDGCHPDPDPDNKNGHGCKIGGDFHDYDHNNHYGTDKNVWCDGRNPDLERHHRGSTVNANLPSGSHFNGGFCMKADLTSSDVLAIHHNNLVKHDKVWLLSGDATYYPIVVTPGDTVIHVKDNSWCDRNPAAGKVEADVLLSAKTTSGGGGQTDSGGGGCNNFNGNFLMLVTLIFPFFKKKSRK